MKRFNSERKGARSKTWHLFLLSFWLALLPASAYGLRSIQAQDSPALAEAVAAGMEEEKPQLRPGPLKVHIRWMLEDWDMPEVLAIEQSVEQPEGGAPWLKEDFLRASNRRNTIPLVAEFKDKVVGFMIYKLHKKQFQLIKLAVHPDYRDHNVGTALVERLVRRLSPLRYTRIVMDIPEAHLGSQLFLKKMGFQAIPWGEGLYRFVYRLPGTDEPPEDLLLRKPKVASDSLSGQTLGKAGVSAASDVSGSAGRFEPEPEEEAFKATPKAAVPQGLPMDLLVAQILERSGGKFILKGALDILKALEFIVSSSKEELPFTRWRDAYALLSQAARQFELGEVSKILPLLADSDRRDPREELARFFESFRSSHQGEHTYEVLDPLRRGETEAGPSTSPPQEGSSGLGTGLEEAPLRGTSLDKNVEEAPPDGGTSPDRNLEEASPEAILDRLEESAQGAGVVVLEAEVIHLGAAAGLEQIFLALGAADSFVQTIDAAGLEERLSRLARQRAA